MRGFALLLRSKVGGGHSRQSLPRGNKAGKVEAEHLNLDKGFKASAGQLLKERRRTGQ
jgi:hypothetical protein